MRLLLALIFALNLAQAQSFSKQRLLGSWELSSAKINRTVAFAKYIGKERNEALELVFNKRGQMKIPKTGEVFNYEVIQGKLKIYETKVYRNNYQIKQKNRYDLLKIIGNVEGCQLVKIVKKKIPGYKSRHDLKMCKIANYPQPTYQTDILKYKF